MIDFKVIIFGLSLIGAQFCFGKVDYVELRQGRVVSFEYEFFDSARPTLVLLPGVYRGMESDDQALEIVKQKKINFVSLHFSSHPQSVIRAIEMGKSPQFDGMSLETLKDEVVSVIKFLNVHNPLVVSLSFSGAVSTLFSKDEFPLVVDVVPLGRQDDNSSFLQSYYDGLQALNSWNSFMLSWLENLKAQAYLTYWTKQVAGLRVKYPELSDAATFSSVVRGMVAMSQTVEKFELENSDFRRGPERIFFLAGNEESKRLKRQKKAVEAYESQTGRGAEVKIFENAGHVLPADAPEEYVAALENSLQKLMEMQKLLPQSRELVSLPRENFTAKTVLKCKNLLSLK